MPAGSVFVPSDIELEDGRLHWGAGGARYKHVSSRMLDDFIDLHDADDSSILRFARKWGVIGVCRHGLPGSHNQYPLGLMEGVRPCLPMLVTSSAVDSGPR